MCSMLKQCSHSDQMGEAATDRRGAESCPLLDKDTIYTRMSALPTCRNEVRVVGQFEEEISTLMFVFHAVNLPIFRDPRLTDRLGDLPDYTSV